MAAANLPITVFKCTYQGCRSTPFLTKSNLNRHVKSTHGPKVTVLCGKERANHSYNNKRHEKRCSKCREIKSQRSATGASDGDQHSGANDTPPPPPPPPPSVTGQATEPSGITKVDLDFLDVPTWPWDDSFYTDQNWP